LDLNYPTNQNKIFIVFIKLVDAVGISIIIASIFTYTSGTSQFIEINQRLTERPHDTYHEWHFSKKRGQVFA